MTVERDRLVTDHARRQEESAIEDNGTKPSKNRHSRRLADLDGADLVEAIENHEGLTALQEVVDPIGRPPNAAATGCARKAAMSPPQVMSR